MTSSNPGSRKQKRAEHEARTGLVATMALLGWKCVRWTEGGKPNAFVRQLNGFNKLPKLRIVSAVSNCWRVELDEGKTHRPVFSMPELPLYMRLDRTEWRHASASQLAIIMNAEVTKYGCDYFTESENFAGDQRTVLCDDPVQPDRGRNRDYAKWQAIVDRCNQRD